MEIEAIMQSARTLLEPWAEAITTPEPYRLDAAVRTENLISAVSKLLESGWGYLSTITGLDHPTPAAPESQPEQTSIEGELELLYHFCSGPVVATLRVRMPYSSAVVPSICHLIPSATLYERELIEMFGIDITGTPDTEHFILPENWPAGVYPLRKSFTGLSTLEANQKG